VDQNAKAIHEAAIVIDCLEISNWSETVFKNMRLGGLTVSNFGTQNQL